MRCSSCDRDYEYDRKKGHTKTHCNSCMVNRRRFAVKERALEYKGGKCVDCGYSKCKRALQFHHLRDKDFDFSGAHARRWKVLEAELDKCVLLCANCHAERHDGR